MDRAGKKQFMDGFTATCSAHSCLIVVRQTGLKASEVTQLRRDVHKDDLQFQVVKNSLVKKALPESMKAMGDSFKGSVGIFFANDPIKAAKVVDTFGKRKEDRFFPLALYLDGKVLPGKEISVLASLLGLDDIRAQILRTILSSGTKIAVAMMEMPRQIKQCLQAKIEKSSEENPSNP